MFAASRPVCCLSNTQCSPLLRSLSFSFSSPYHPVFLNLSVILPLSVPEIIPSLSVSHIVLSVILYIVTVSGWPSPFS
jgi:hypothetical protein